MTTCPVSFDRNPVTYLDLSFVPLVNNLCSTKQASLDAPRYPLAIQFHGQSKLSSLTEVVDPAVLFSNYAYTSGVSKPYVDHCRAMASYVTKFIQPKLGDLFVDIGGNDCTLLNQFREEHRGVGLLNVDPATNQCETCSNRLIPTLNAFWGEKAAGQVGRALCITSTNVFQHGKDIEGFVQAVHDTLQDDGIWVLEFPYWKRNMETLQWDQTYHEHIYYFLLTPLKILFNRLGLDIIDVSEHPIHGGTMRVVSRRSRAFAVQPQCVTDALRDEAHMDEQWHVLWGLNCNNHMNDCASLMLKLLEADKRVAGFGAAAKGCTFLNALGLNHEDIEYVVDDTPAKQGLFIPGTGIPIVGRKALLDSPPDYLIILAHNFAPYIMEQMRPIYKGKFVVMFPNPRIIE